MKKEFLLIFLVLIVSTTIQAQTRGTKVGYIDMEYILQNVPNYTEAQSQLEQKAQKWKQEIESKKNEITKLKEALKAEKALLTKGLIEERNSEIVFLENENLEFQQRRFGPNGDLITQKNALAKPIQDQVFTAVQDIAEAKKYDFIFDKTSDMTMLFAAKRFDISDQIVRILNRAEKSEQLTKKQLKEEEAREAKKEAIADNPNLSERQKDAETKKLARDAAIAARLLVQEERKKAAEDKKLQIIADREAKKNGTAPSTAKTDTTLDKEAAVAAAAQAKQAQADQRAETLRIRQQAIDDKKKAAEERRLQILADREAKKLGTNQVAVPAVGNEGEKQVTKSTDVATAAEEAKQKQAEARAKILEDRKKVAEENKKVQEEKRKQALDAKKAGTVSENTVKGDEKTPKSAETTKTEKETVVAQETTKTSAEEAKQKQADARAKTLEDRKKVAEENKKALEEKRKQALDAKKTGTVSENAVKVDEKNLKPAETTKTEKETVVAKETTKPTAEEAKQKQADARAKVIEDRNKEIEERKKALEEKRKKILEDREAAKKANEEKLKTTKENTNNN
jgi:Skp family chaperone for outer membrane proteins